MALSKNQKNTIVDEVAGLLGESRMTVVAKYQGIGVKDLQSLRKTARDNGTLVKVVKNRLVKQAIKKNDRLSSVDTTALEGMLLYAFNKEDEVAAAQVLNGFAKTNTNLVFVGAISSEGEFVAADQVKELANLPGKTQLIAGVINTLNAPLRNSLSGLSGGLSAIIGGLEAHAK